MMTLAESEKTPERSPESVQLDEGPLSAVCRTTCPTTRCFMIWPSCSASLAIPLASKFLYALFESELCVNDIAQVVGISQSAVSHQLRLLKTSKLVKFRREGQGHVLLPSTMTTSAADRPWAWSIRRNKIVESLPPGEKPSNYVTPILKITIYKGDCHHAEEIQDRSRLRELRRQN